MRRSLALKRETLSDLTPAELTSVAGGSHLCRVTDNCGETLTHPSIDQPCPTIPITWCVAIDDPNSIIC